MNSLQDSWSGFSSDIARKYLKGFGYPSEDSKRLLADILAQNAKSPLRLVELGCGNAQLAEYFISRGMNFTYTGVDFSDPLLDAARASFVGNPKIHFIKDDVESLGGVKEHFDIAIYSHVIEMLGAPEASLRAAKRIADRIAIRFFEPPEHDVSRVELKYLDVGGTQRMPYLRWSLGRDFYRLILANLGVTRVDLYQSRDRDQVHILHFD
jgi:ubiquinone/menaquinone biosynthesis C-methylase UbiE